MDKVTRYQRQKTKHTEGKLAKLWDAYAMKEVDITQLLASVSEVNTMPHGVGLARAGSQV